VYFCLLIILLIQRFLENKGRDIQFIICLCIVVGLFMACSNKKNTAISRLYHDVNTRYNVHFNANESYKEALQIKRKNIEANSNFSDLLYTYPLRLDTTQAQYKGQFTKTIDKTSKAIKLHSISRKPQIDRSRIKDEKYKNWIRSKEFNPFLVTHGYYWQMPNWKKKIIWKPLQHPSIFLKFMKMILT